MGRIRLSKERIVDVLQILIYRLNERPKLTSEDFRQLKSGDAEF
jgi:hypothetical protein